MAAKPDVQALLFDVFGTVVDWRTSIIEDLTRFGAEKGIKADWAAFTDDWRGLYQPAMEEVRSGRRAWTILDVLHRESLEKLVDKYAIAGLSEADKDHINRVWHRLRPWPDTIEGLTRLKTRYIIGTLSNGNVGLLTRMAKHAGLPWDVVLGAETARRLQAAAAGLSRQRGAAQPRAPSGDAGGGPQRRPCRGGNGRAAHRIRRPADRVRSASKPRLQGRPRVGRRRRQLRQPRQGHGLLTPRETST